MEGTANFKILTLNYIFKSWVNNQT